MRRWNRRLPLGPIELDENDGLVASAAYNLWVLASGMQNETAGLVYMGKAQIFFSLISACSLAAWAQSTSPADAPARMVITIGHHYGHEPPLLTKDDLIVQEQHMPPLRITNFVPLRGDRAGLELFLLVDNCSNLSPLQSSKNCISSLVLNRSPPLSGSPISKTDSWR